LQGISCSIHQRCNSQSPIYSNRKIGRHRGAAGEIRHDPSHLKPIRSWCDCNRAQASRNLERRCSLHKLADAKPELLSMAWTDTLDASHTTTHELEIVLRLLMAAGAGAAIGIEREIKDRPAGLRTHMLTALAAAVFTILTFEIYFTAKGTGDPIRVIEAVTAGVAFLAAGAIIQGRRGVEGLTTGAGMWMAGALGVACGAGYYILTAIATVLTVLILAVLMRLDFLFGGPKDEPSGQAPARPSSGDDAVSRT
jgi:putative Mg2+ transporter-C (MgtC) family protein